MKRRAKGFILVPAAALWLLAVLMTASVAASTINIEFDDAPVTQIYETLASLAGYNVLLDPSVEGKASFTLVDIEPMEAVELVSSLLGHGYVLRHSTLLVATEGRLDEISSQTLAYYTLKHATEEEVRQVLAMVLTQDQIFVRDETVILQGSERTLRDARVLLEQIDRPKARPAVSGRRDVLSVLEDLTAELGLNLVADPELADRFVAVAMRDGDARNILYDVKDLVGFRIRETEDTLFASLPVNEVPPEEEREQVKVYLLDYADPESIRDSLTMVVRPENIRVDVFNNRVMVRGTPAVLLDVDDLIWQLDVPKQQVLMEVWVHEMSTNALQNLGIEWKGVPSFDGFPNFADGPTFFEVIWEPWELVLALRILEQRGEATVLANPKIATVSGQEASIFVGDRVPIVEQTEDGPRLVEYIQAGIDLSVTPRISQDGYITINVRPEVSTFVTRGGFPEIRTREAETTVRVKNGQPIMIGGLLQEEELERLRRIPILADLPVLGNLFQWRNIDHRKTEMNIFLIPRIVDGTEGVVTQDFFTQTQ